MTETARRRSSITLAVAAAALPVPPRAAAAETPPALARAEASGLTAELAAGVSGAILVGPPHERFSPGVAPMIAGAGWQTSGRLAVGLRSVTYVIPATVAGRREPFLASSIGPAASMWLDAQLLVGAAIGPCLVWPSPVGASPYLMANRGAVVSLRAAWSARRAAGGDVLVGAELLPTFFAGGDLLFGTLLTVGLLWR